MEKVTIKLNYLELAQIKRGLEKQIENQKEILEEYPNDNPTINCLEAAELALAKVKVKIDDILYK